MGTGVNEAIELCEAIDLMKEHFDSIRRESAWELRQREEPLYHYTSDLGLKGIFSSNHIWATHAAFLNDPHENRYFSDVFSDALDVVDVRNQEQSWKNREKGNENKHEREFIHDLISDYRRNTGLGDWNSAYCASFSAKGDDLSQFRAYSSYGAGYCIAFDVRQMLDIFDLRRERHEPSFQFIRVRYGDGHIFGISKNAIGNCVALANRVKESDHEHLRREFLIQVGTLGMCYKKEGFSDEQEWRLIPDFPPSLNVDEYMRTHRRYRERDGYLIPYIPIRLTGPDENLHIVTSLITGPRLDFSLAEMSLRSFLSDLKLYDHHFPHSSIKIEASATALR